MRVVIVGGFGTIGSAVAAALSSSDEIVPLSRSTFPLKVDISSLDSIKQLFDELGAFDALVCAAGAARFAPLENLTEDEFRFSLSNKLMGQVNLVRVGMAAIRDKGSFTLTGGFLAGEPAPGSSAVSLVNAGLEGFVRAAALELPRRLRINIVSPPWVSETLEAMGQDGADGLPASVVAEAYVHSLKGGDTGRVIDARLFRRT
jgi:NAD(P)-dependent dehydrogenase (short-subunit alcohol dehydrogenase family)